ncbi:MAG TPA: hypothetical protein VKS01_07030, partial [Bryobacteraceae bacterium]|nr:hypothetical protein [Bryobacteraceae bacterium]
MTAVERAKRFLQQKSRTLAMTAIPLAGLVAVSAPTAKAGIIFGTGGCSVSANGTATQPGSTCSLTGLPAANGVTGLTLFGSGAAISPSSGASLELLFGNSGGLATGTFSGGLSINFDFTINDSASNVVAWDLNFFFQAPSSGSFDVNSSTTGFSPITGSGTVSGTAVMPGVNATASSNWFLQLTV